MSDWWEQSGCVTYRTDGHQVEVGLITNRDGYWIFPKGTIDPGATSTEAALQEVWEEAGWEGRLDPYSLVDVIRPKYDLNCRIRFYAMEVTREHDSFPESWRERCWVPIDEALHLIDDRPMRAALKAWRNRRDKNPPRTLFVCPTNLGGSVMAEYLWRRASDGSLPVASAGLVAQSGREVPPLVAAVLSARELDAGSHRAQQLDEDLLTHADRVFVCDTTTRDECADRFPKTADALELVTDPLPPVPSEPNAKAYATYFEALAEGVSVHLQQLRQS